MADLLRGARGKEIALAANYLSGRLPQGRLGIGWATLEAALKDLAGSQGSLELTEVDLRFEALSNEKGAGSQEKRLVLLRDFFSRTGPKERDFIAALILGEIRQGALEGLVLEAIAQASSLPEDRLRQALMFSGNIGEVAQAAMEEGTAALSRFEPVLFHPVSPMLANAVDGEGEALARLGEAAWEFKIDGARIQIHKEGDEVRIFSRHLKEVTQSIPELVQLARTFRAEKAIFEGEAVALHETGKPHPFQTTMRRFRRIKDVRAMQARLPLASYFFDLLYLEGDPLFDTPYQKRFELLTEMIPPEHLIPRIITADQGEAQAFLEKSLVAGHEGLMVKGLKSPYTAGHRGYYWLKLKPAQTLDLVVLAAEWGHGRRRGWLSNLHLGARDPESGRWVMLGKSFMGLTDEMLRWQTERLLKLEIGREERTVYVRPELVVEVAFNDVQESQRYPGGLALRFARIKHYREEKPPGEADTIQKIWAIFEERRE